VPYGSPLVSEDFLTLSATEFVTNNIIEVLGGASLLITSLSAYLGKLLAGKSLEREKGFIAKNLQLQKEAHSLEMKNIENKLQLEMVKQDQFHQISKTTFEKIFETKIDIYTNLLTLKIYFNKFYKESHDLEVGEDDPTDHFYSLFMKCREMLESNKLYISSELSNKYDQWHTKALPYLKQANVEGYHAHGMAYTERENWENVWEAQAPIFSKMIGESFTEMLGIFEQIDRDIALIRENINSPIGRGGT
jgi:hypothetical protein